jgi:hypothetical protein
MGAPAVGPTRPAADPSPAIRHSAPRVPAGSGPVRHGPCARAKSSQAQGLNNRGQIVGSAYRDPAATAGRGFLLAKGPRGAFTPINFPGAANTVVTGINNRGLIVGAYQNPTAAPSPQPDSSSPPVDMPPGLLGRPGG